MTNKEKNMNNKINSEKDKFTKSGYEDLDRMIGGFPNGGLTIIESRYNLATIACLITTLITASKRGLSSLYFSHTDNITAIQSGILRDKNNEDMIKKIDFTDNLKLLDVSSYDLIDYDIIVVHDITYAHLVQKDLFYIEDENPFEFLAVRNLEFIANDLNIPAILVTNPIDNGNNGHLSFNDYYDLPTVDPSVLHMHCISKNGKPRMKIAKYIP